MTELILVNAIYFNASWKKPFEETKKVSKNQNKSKFFCKYMFQKLYLSKVLNDQIKICSTLRCMKKEKKAFTGSSNGRKI